MSILEESPMRKIVVTGGSGKAGRACVADLAHHGYDVVNVDVAASRDPDQPTVVADLTDLGQAVEVLRGVDAVIHLAAIPAPNILTDAETFRINMMSTYNVFSAAATLELSKVVWASSETLIGIPFERHDPAYAPIDEEHPLLPEFHYALSKLTGEVIADQFNRWHGIPYLGLRISNIMEPQDYQRFPGWQDDPRIRRWNLWGYVDARDVAQSARLALESDLETADNFLVAAADTCMDRPSTELMAEVFPDVPVTRPLQGHATLLSIEKARSLLGYDPQYTWHDQLE
jgi:nucleoside-diphosphate-sugar epimerase